MLESIKKLLNLDPLSRYELSELIKEAQVSGDWSEVENADVSEITNMSSLFYKVKGIQDLDLSKWDTSNVTDMSSMFSNSDFNSPLSFDTSNVINMGLMFHKASFNKSLSFDTSNVKTMKDIFKDSLFNQDISEWVIQNTKGNQNVIKYRDECIIKRKEKEVIKASIKNNKSNTSSRGFRL